MKTPKIFSANIHTWKPLQKELVVTYIESPCMFWASLVNQIGKQVDIDTKLANLCATLPKIKSEPVLGKVGFYSSCFTVLNPSSTMQFIFNQILFQL